MAEAAWLAKVWQLRRAGVALYTAGAATGLWLACLPGILLLGQPSAAQLILQLACIAAACLAAAWASSLALVAREPISLPQAAGAALHKLLGGHLHYQLARSWGHWTSAACWRACSCYSAAASTAGALLAATFAADRASALGARHALKCMNQQPWAAPSRPDALSEQALRCWAP